MLQIMQHLLLTEKNIMNKAKTEYRKYQVKTITPVEEAYLNTVKFLAKDITKKNKSSTD